METTEFQRKLAELEAQLHVSHDKLVMRENVISQLEEEIKGKERLIFEQNHLINILENESASQSQLQAIRCDNNNKYDSDSINSESEITVIEREIVASSSSTSPCSSEKSGSSGDGGGGVIPSLFRHDDCQLFRSELNLKSSSVGGCKCETKLEQAMVDRERLELQNEQLLKQWEEALEYVSSIMETTEFQRKLAELEAQLHVSHDKLVMRENVISQLEEEIKGKERLIFEQNHLINILENESASQSQLQAIRCDNNNKYDSDSINSESEITVIEREIVASSSSTSPCSSEKSGSSGDGGGGVIPSLFRHDDCQLFRSELNLKSSSVGGCKCETKLEQAMVDRERLELQNEQLLKQWEEALEYVSSVQRQLQEELKRNTQLKHEMNQRAKDDVLEIPRNVLHLMSFIVLVFGYLLYRL